MYNKMNLDAVNKRVGKMVYLRARKVENLENIHVSISEGNSKMGAIPSVSLIPIADCINCKNCITSCYDVRADCIYIETLNSRAVNSALAHNDLERYFKEISMRCYFYRAFRWHIGGDILSDNYLKGMVKVADENPECKFLAFTKAFEVVNAYLDKNPLPENLKIVFSGWVGLDMPNPHNLPTAHPIFPDGTTSAPNGAKLCNGNCSECFLNKNGCFDLKNGESVVFIAH